MTIASTVIFGATNASASPVNSKAGLTYLHKRVYDSGLGRLISPDPLVPSTDNASLNRYSYALNDPAVETDPSGLNPFLNKIIALGRRLIWWSPKSKLSYWQSVAEHGVDLEALRQIRRDGSPSLGIHAGQIYDAPPKRLVHPALLGDLCGLDRMCDDVERLQEAVTEARAIDVELQKTGANNYAGIGQANRALDEARAKRNQFIETMDRIFAKDRDWTRIRNPNPNPNQAHKVIFYLVPAGTAAGGGALATTNKQANAQSPPSAGNNGHAPPQNTGSTGNSTPFGPPFPPPLPQVAPKCEIVTEIVPQPC